MLPGREEKNGRRGRGEGRRTERKGKVKEDRKRTEDAVNVGQEKMRKAGEIDG